MEVNEIYIWFDPACPWTWRASRALLEASRIRGKKVIFKSFSLYLKNKRDVKKEDSYTLTHQKTLKILRVMEAVRNSLGDETVEKLYAVAGDLIHNQGEDPGQVVEQMLERTGIKKDFAHEKENESWDKGIQTSMDEALVMTGKEVGVPIVELGSSPGVAFWGPIVKPMPVGEDALKLLDGLELLYSIPGFFELKRAKQ